MAVGDGAWQPLRGMVLRKLLVDSGFGLITNHVEARMRCVQESVIWPIVITRKSVNTVNKPTIMKDEDPWPRFIRA